MTLCLRVAAWLWAVGGRWGSGDEVRVRTLIRAKKSKAPTVPLARSWKRTPKRSRDASCHAAAGGTSQAEVEDVALGLGVGDVLVAPARPT